MKPPLLLSLLAFPHFFQKTDSQPLKNWGFDCEIACTSFWQGRIFGKLDELDDNNYLLSNIGEGPLWHPTFEHPAIEIDWNFQNGHLTFRSSCGPIACGKAWLDACVDEPILLGQGQITPDGSLEFTPPATFFEAMGEDCTELHFDFEVLCGG